MKKSRIPRTMSVYGRKERLCAAINKFLQDKFFATNLPMQKIAFSVEDLLRLKQALSSVNNLVTTFLTFSFADYLHDIKLIDDKQLPLLRNKIDSTNPNANGYDVCFQYEDVSIVAEVKANVPASSDGKRYGGAQLRALIKDIEGLWEGKGSVDKKTHERSYKFMVILDCGDMTQARGQLLENCQRIREDIKLQELKRDSGTPPLRQDTVYVLALSLESAMESK